MQVPARFDYEVATSVEEAIELLERHGPEARLLAGGHSLIPMMKLRLAFPETLIDIHELDGDLRYIREEDGALEIGALARHQDVSGLRGREGTLPDPRRRGDHDRRPPGPQHGYRRRLSRPRGPGGRPACGVHGPGLRGRGPRPRRRADHSTSTSYRPAPSRPYWTRPRSSWAPASCARRREAPTPRSNAGPATTPRRPSASP